MFLLGACAVQIAQPLKTQPREKSDQLVSLAHGIDESAGGVQSYIITTAAAIYYLEKAGGGLSSMLDPNGVDWIGFHRKPGSGHNGEYRGFPNAVHRQDGNFFHAMNAGTDASTSFVNIETGNHVRITFTSGNGKWQGRYDFYPDRLDFTMSKVSPGHKYWIQYEGVPGGSMDDADFWYRSGDNKRHGIREDIEGDLPAPEWMAFGDPQSARMLYMLNHGDDAQPDDYANREPMTVFAFGRSGKEKFLTEPQKFSIGFVESMDYAVVDREIRRVLE
ncbi:hypothetical protein [Parasphingorhabdus sp.]